MQNIKIVGRHIKITKAISDYVNKRFGGLDKYVRKITSIQVILEVEKYRHSSEIVMHTYNKKVFRIKEVDENLYIAIDKSANRLKDMLLRYKERIVSSRKHRKKITEILSLKEKFLQQESNYKTSTLYLQAMSLEEAMKQHDLEKKDYFIFLNKMNDKICIIQEIDGEKHITEIETSSSR